MTNQATTDNVIIIGAGIMGATMGTLLKQLEPEWDITVLDKSEGPGKESSNEWNNAGTGHAALCELNYTTEQEDGSIDIRKAIDINEQFQVSKQFWAHLVEKQEIANPEEFIRPLPHISFVHNAKNVDFLKRRYEAMSRHPMFDTIAYTEDREKLAEWIPLIMEGRPSDEPVAGSKIHSGTDVNFGELTRKLMHNLENQNHVYVRFNQDVLDINRMEDGTWEVKIRNDDEGTLEYRTADFVFIGAGGEAIPLLQKTGIPESKHIGGFPISGEFLTCTNPEIVNKHHAKVYGKEPEGKPPMTVPHLDRRYIDNQNMLLFGPFAGFGPKFLKNGSNFDLLKSMQPDNMATLLAAGAKNIPLIRYSINQALLTKKDRMKELRQFIPEAKNDDWQLVVAGKRVQVIKDTDESGKGMIQFGTEVVQSEDHTLAALLGESPGASTAVSIMLSVLNNNFPEHIKTWEPKLKEMIPSYGESLAENPDLLKSIHASSANALRLKQDMSW